jgi:hypothetical protein
MQEVENRAISLKIRKNELNPAAHPELVKKRHLRHPGFSFSAFQLSAFPAFRPRPRRDAG